MRSSSETSSELTVLQYALKAVDTASITEEYRVDTGDSVLTRPYKGDGKRTKRNRVREVNFAVRIADRVLRALLRKHPAIFPQKRDPIYAPGDESPP